MLVRYSLINQASGSIGGVTGARNRGGNYLRKRVKPNNPKTDAQYSARLALAGAASGWRALTDGQRLAWAGYADSLAGQNSVGEEAKPSGFQCFVATNSLRKRLGLSNITTAPVTPGRATFTPPTAVEYDTGAQDVTLDITLTDSWAATAGGVLYVQFGKAVSQGVTYYSSPFQIVAQQVRGASAPSDPLVLASVEAPYGDLDAGANVRVRIGTMDSTGRLSTPWEGTLTIA